MSRHASSHGGGIHLEHYRLDSEPLALTRRRRLDREHFSDKGRCASSPPSNNSFAGHYAPVVRTQPEWLPRSLLSRSSRAAVLAFVITRVPRDQCGRKPTSSLCAQQDRYSRV